MTTRLGDVTGIVYRHVRLFRPAQGPEWRLDPVHSGGGLLLDLGSHALDLFDYLLDSTASAQQLGKPVLSDLKEGKVTLPLIYAMENGHREARELVARVLKEKEFDSVRPETLVALVNESGALDVSIYWAGTTSMRVATLLPSRLS